MLKKEREAEIINIFKDSGGFVTVKALCKALFASESSIRRDLSALESKGVIKRRYGGAELVTNYSNVAAFNSRSNHNIAAKKVIAKKAARLVKDGDVIFLDQSSTAFFLAAEIIDKNSITIVTNNIEIISLMSGSNIRIISSGGMLSPENRTCLVGKDAQRTFENMYADIMFFSTKSISSDGNIWDISQAEIEVRMPMLKNASKKVYLCDSEKFDSHSPYRQCSLDDIDFLISEIAHARQFIKTPDSLTLI
ncbi:MAG: DeoR/GlpR transcriptional regulator [Ruminococcaceae bacterium]|nr:DeoR/GlpR transcriptional regulator [Oscillospiraceae bacterium]